MHFLFTAPSAILSQKDVKLSYFPFSSLSFIISSTGAIPTFLILPSPNLIFPVSSTANLRLLLFISGFNISIFNALQ